MDELSPPKISLSATGIRKSFGGIPALSGVDFKIRAGEIHALMGENGAGKSTLIKTLTGLLSPDSGEILLNEERIAPANPLAAQALGISTVYQEVNLIPTLSIAENIVLGRQPTRFWGLDWKAMQTRAENALVKLGVQLDVSRVLGDQSIAIQQMVAIARALDISAQVLILDEPTSSLDADEVEKLFQVMRRLKSEGMAIVFVTHFLDQVYAVSDRITVLRNGTTVCESTPSQLPEHELVGKMMGIEIQPAKEVLTNDRFLKSTNHRAPLLELVGAGRKPTVHPTNLTFSGGESLGLAGLLGSGRSEIARMIFGIEPKQFGVMKLLGTPVHFSNPRQAIRSGFALIPEDRKTQAIFPELSVRENMMLANQVRRGWFRPISRKEQNEIYAKFTESLRIACASSEQSISSLSGGNQQKVILARWLAADPKFLILDEPTRGIDVGAKAQVQRWVQTLVQNGMAVLFISSEMEEMVACSDRIVVLRDRQVVRELAGEALTPHSIVASIAGGNAQ